MAYSEQLHLHRESRRPRWPKWASPKLLICVVIGFALLAFFHTSDISQLHPKQIIDRLTAARPERTIAHACSNIPRQELARLRTLNKFSLHAFHYNGQPVNEERQVDSTIGPACIVVAVPQLQKDEYTDTPIRGKGPDDIHLYINGTTGVAIDFLPLEPLRDKDSTEILEEYYNACPSESFSGDDHFAKMYDCWSAFYDDQYAQATVILYGAAVSFIQGGSYTMYAEIERSHYRWAHQWIDDFHFGVTRFPTGLEIQHPANYTERQMAMAKPIFETLDQRHVDDNEKYPALISVPVHNGLETDWNNRGYCDRGVSAGQGRYYSRQFYPNYPEEVYDEWGFVWDGDFCKMDYYSSREIVECFRDRKITAYGDSNVRRLTESIMAGNTFCHDTKARCQDDDDGNFTRLSADEAGRLKPWSTEIIIADGTDWNWRYLPFEYGFNSTVELAFVRSIAYQWHDWTRRLYDISDLNPVDLDLIDDIWVAPREEDHVFTPGLDVRAGAIPRHPPNSSFPDLVVVGAPYWDMAFDNHFVDYDVTVPRFVNTFLEAYAGKAPIILKLTQGFCCRPWREEFRRFSAMRLSHFNDVILDAFRPAIERGDVVVLDPRLLTGRPEAVLDFGVTRAAHSRFSRIRTEVQILANLVCERPEGPGSESVPRLRTIEIPS